jgi:putative acetyltransferase
LSKNNYTIREIQQNDNQQIAKVIREVLIEMGVPKVGTAYEDAALDMMFETYKNNSSTYYVVTKADKIIGGAGIAQLKNSTENICELQKMYFSSEARGKGLGSQIGYEKCYLETLPYMNDARKLYEKVGFQSLDRPLGDTGHYSCNMWMIKTL